MFASKKGNCIIIIIPFCTVELPFLSGENCGNSEKVKLCVSVLIVVYILNFICSSFILNS